MNLRDSTRSGINVMNAHVIGGANLEHSNNSVEEDDLGGLDAGDYIYEGGKSTSGLQSNTFQSNEAKLNDSQLSEYDDGEFDDDNSMNSSNDPAPLPLSSSNKGDRVSSGKSNTFDDNINSSTRSNDWKTAQRHPLGDSTKSLSQVAVEPVVVTDKHPNNSDDENNNQQNPEEPNAFHQGNIPNSSTITPQRQTSDSNSSMNDSPGGLHEVVITRGNSTKRNASAIMVIIKSYQ